MGILKTISVPAVIAAVLFAQTFLFSQDKAQTQNYDAMSLEELLDVKISVASKTSMTQRESPGIVTVITQAEIVNSGARDLNDVFLLLVPGFVPALDVQNTVGIGIRGSWAHEGKALLLVDGQEFNETLYSSVQFSNHISLDQINRIEIIRGPGSATYGGFAELGVVNIITKSAADINGVAAALTYGQMADTFARRNVSLSFGKRIHKVDLVAHSFFGQGNRSDRDYTDVYGNTFNLDGSGDLDPLYFNVGMGYKGLSTRFIVDRFRSTTRDFYDEAYPETLDNDFNSYYAEAKYDFKIGDKLSIVPRFNYKWQSPFECISNKCREYDSYFGKTAERIEENVTLTYDPSKKFSLLAGVDAYVDRARTEDDAPEYDLFPDGKKGIHYTNEAFFAQGLIRAGWADFTVGARVEHHSQAGNSFAPRFGVTKVKGRFHVKGLISRAFRAPGIANILLNPKIKPENTTVMEFEAGYQLTHNSILTGNVFNSRIKKPIVYSFDSELDQETYQNFSETGTRGFELDYRVKVDWGYAGVTYSYYRAIDNKVDYYSVDEKPNMLLGFPTHKLSAISSIRVARDLFVNPSLVFLSERHGYAAPVEEGPAGKFDAICLTNIGFNWRNIGSKGFDLTFGVYDLFAQNLEYIQPYKGSHAPLAGPSREFRVRLGYRWNYKTE